MVEKTLENLRDRSESKLRYAEIHLDELKSLDSIDGSDFDRAHQESFLFHLLGAKDAFLIELVAYYGLTISERDLTAGKLRDEFKKKEKTCPELAELFTLENDKNSWLFHAKEMRDHAIHISAISRQYNLGGEADGQVWLSNPVTGQKIQRHFVEEFIDWVSNMKTLLERLRTTAIVNNTKT